MADTAAGWHLGNNRKPLSEYDFYNYDLYESLGDLKEEMEQIISNGEYTTDYPKLCEKQEQYVFVYGTLKKTFSNHRLIQACDLVGCGFTDSDRYFLTVHKTHGYPIAFFDNREGKRARIYGELYKVPTDLMLTLDNLESNGTIYQRRLLRVNAFGKNGDVLCTPAWIYIGRKDFWETRMTNLLVARRVTPNNNDEPYFIYTKADDN